MFTCSVCFSEHTANIFPVQNQLIRFCKAIYSVVRAAYLNVSVIHINLSLQRITRCQFPEHNVKHMEIFTYGPLCYEENVERA